MATDPFTGAFINRLEDRTHAYRFTCETGEVVSFKFFSAVQILIILQ